jgi:hypothetical protein
VRACARAHARTGWFRFHLLIFRPRYVRLHHKGAITLVRVVGQVVLVVVLVEAHLKLGPEVMAVLRKHAHDFLREEGMGRVAAGSSPRVSHIDRREDSRFSPSCLKGASPNQGVRLR